MLKKGSGNGSAGPIKSMYTANITTISGMASARFASLLVGSWSNISHLPVTGSAIANKPSYWDFPNLSGGRHR